MHFCCFTPIQTPNLLDFCFVVESGQSQRKKYKNRNRKKRQSLKGAWGEATKIHGRNDSISSDIKLLSS